MALVNPGTTKLKGNQVLVQEDDTLEDEVLTLYFDYIYDGGGIMKVTNKTFFESLDNNNENAYGFSQFADTWVVEDQLIFSFDLPATGPVKTSLQVSPSIRHRARRQLRLRVLRSSRPDAAGIADRSPHHGDAWSGALQLAYHRQLYRLCIGGDGGCHVLRKAEFHRRRALRLSGHGVHAGGGLDR
jgi:hypothetical protein